jgi:hypothetical protein
MERTPVSSSNIASIGYDKGTSILEIEFHGGSIYQYLSVPVEVYNSIMGASSHGKYLNQNIKGKYRYQQIR